MDSHGHVSPLADFQGTVQVMVQEHASQWSVCGCVSQCTRVSVSVGGGGGGAISLWLQMCISDTLNRELSSISNVHYMIGDCISHIVVSVANTVINRQFGRERDTQDCCSHSG